MKSATSTLHVQLSHQPGFWMSEPKEPNFFSDDDVWSRGLDWYSGLFSGAGSSDIRGESSTHYTKLPDYPNCLARMRDHVPDVRLIYIMRHPVDRLISHYMHGWLNSSIKTNIDDAVSKHPQLLDYGRYAMQLRPFLETYGPANILPVFFERLTKHPQEELERVCSFLGYSGSPLWNSDESEQNVSLQRMKVSPMRDALVGFPPLRILRRRLVPKSVRDRLKRAWQLPEKPQLSPAILQRVSDTFDSDLETLGEWLAADLNCRSFKTLVSATSLNWNERTPAPFD